MTNAVPTIDLATCVELHLKTNPADNRRDLVVRLQAALAARGAGAVCDCGNPIWVIGSAVAGYTCFTCITGEAVPSGTTA
ncbi:MAG: hypothetical protein ACREYC_26035 [Gammaproteobacteria bacterium]